MTTIGGRGGKDTERWEALRRRLYPRAASVVTLTEGAMQYFDADIRERGWVIPNPVCPPPADLNISRASESVSRLTLVALGRLVPVKGFDILIEAFARIAPKHPEWSLSIWGEGPCREGLEALVRRLGLTSQVRLCGVSRIPYHMLLQADLFVVASHSEGFCNALLEAMACGLTAVSFAVQGTRTIIRHGVDGVLVAPGDVSALAAALSRLMGDAAERQRLAGRAPEVLDRFDLDRIMGMWGQLLEEVGVRP